MIYYILSFNRKRTKFNKKRILMNRNRKELPVLFDALTTFSRFITRRLNCWKSITRQFEKRKTEKETKLFMLTD